MNLGLDVINVDALTYAATEASTAMLATYPNYRFVEANILDQKLIANLLIKEAPEAVVHLAAESHVDRSIDGPLEFVKTNVLGTVTLLEAVRGYLATLPPEKAQAFRFLHVSTDEVFGSLGLADAPFSETTAYTPNSPYSASKAASDHFVRAYYETYKLPILLTNCSNNYGNYHFPEKLIPLVIIKALNGEPLPVYGTGENIRDWLFVEDHAQAILTVLQHGRVGESYNVGGDSERTNLAVVQSICDILDQLVPNKDIASRRSLINFVKDRPGHDLRYAIDARKINTELGWTPSVTFDEGLRKTVIWYLENESWWRAILDKGAYAGQRLGSESKQAITR